MVYFHWRIPIPIPILVLHRNFPLVQILISNPFISRSASKERSNLSSLKGVCAFGCLVGCVLVISYKIFLYFQNFVKFQKFQNKTVFQDILSSWDFLNGIFLPPHPQAQTDMKLLSFDFGLKHPVNFTSHFTITLHLSISVSPSLFLFPSIYPSTLHLSITPSLFHINGHIHGGLKGTRH